MTTVAPPPQLLQLATAFWVSRALYVAAKLGIADLLAAGPKACDLLAREAGANPNALYRVMRALASVGVFREAEDGQFALTPVSAPLQSQARGSLRDFVVMLGEPESWRAWGEILYSVKTGHSAFEHVFGTSVFDYMADHPEAGRLFDCAMANRSSAENDAVLEAYDFSPVTRLVDVGGGNGAFLNALAQKFPAMQRILFDLPAVIGRVNRENGCEPVAGNFFTDPIPEGADVYVLKKVIHDWDDAAAASILENCARAMKGNPASRLLLIEPVIMPGDAPSFPKLLDLFMMIWPGGRERSLDEHRTLLASAGLDVRRVIETKSPVSIIEGVRSSA